MSNTLEKHIQKFDMNKDGVITEEEMKRSTDILEMELREEKAEAQKRMSWVAILSMVLFTVVLFTPFVTESRVSVLSDLLGLFYLAQASIVGFYFGAQAYMSKSQLHTSKR